MVEKNFFFYEPAVSRIGRHGRRMPILTVTLVAACTAIFLLSTFAPLDGYMDFVPLDAVRMPWTFVTSIFMHASFEHLFFNMFALWMFGGELEAAWGTRFFLKFYFVTGIGAGILTVLFSLLPLEVAQQLYISDVIGASGAIYGLLLAYGMQFPDRPIYMYFLFPIPARIFVLIMGALAFYASFSETGGGIANATHLSGLLVAYIYLKNPRVRPMAELKYQYARWKIDRARRRFDVHPGGRSDRIH